MIPISLRNKIRSLHKKIGQKEFYLKLVKLDPLAKEKINPTDSQRSIRAYEIKVFTKKSLYEWFKRTKSDFNKTDFFKIYIDFPRKELIERINLRTEEMIKIGAIKEVKKFINLKVKADNSVNKAIGIQEIKEYLKQEKKLSEIKEKISTKTRQYAKRQSTWARSHMLDWIKLQPSEKNKFLEKIPIIHS